MRMALFINYSDSDEDLGDGDVIDEVKERRGS
jgi:hypothetical protein